MEVRRLLLPGTLQMTSSTPICHRSYRLAPARA